MLGTVQVRKINNHGAHHAEGVVVVIDVLRAFTTAAFAFESGAKEIILVKEHQEALDLRKQVPDAVIIGEINRGQPTSDFDYLNSPSQIQDAPLSGKTVILRTSSGTQGAVNAKHAEHLLLASFCTAQATLQYIRKLDPQIVTFVITSSHSIDEDLALADYLEARLLLGDEVTPCPYLKRVDASSSAQLCKNNEIEYMPKEDLDLALQIDKFSFYINTQVRDNLLVANRCLNHI